MFRCPIMPVLRRYRPDLVEEAVTKVGDNPWLAWRFLIRHGLHRPDMDKMEIGSDEMRVAIVRVIQESAMRMWMIDPRLLCDHHLLGEHGELHKFRPSFVKRVSVAGRCELRQIEPLSMARRHEALAEEMLRRGMKHESPYTLPPLDHLTPRERLTRVNRATSIADLSNRCADCARRITGEDR